MKVRIHNDALQEAHYFETLDYIVFLFSSGRHIWDVGNADDVLESAWLTAEPDSRTTTRNIDTLKRCYTSSIYEPATSGSRPMTITVCLNPSHPNEYTPGEAFDVLIEPAYVLVEDGNSDGGFLETMIAAFDRGRLANAITNRWLLLHHAGGYGAFRNRVQEIRRTLKGPLRVVAVADSDALFPGHQSATINYMDDLQRTEEILCFVLRKRKIENYILPDLLPRGGVRRRTYYAFLELSAPQRDHYEMKGGFRKSDNRQAEVPGDQEELFRHTPRKILENLTGGFGNDVSDRFVSHREKFNAASVRLCCESDPGEIERLLDEIESIL